MKSSHIFQNGWYPSHMKSHWVNLTIEHSAGDQAEQFDTIYVYIESHFLQLHTFLKKNPLFFRHFLSTTVKICHKIFTLSERVSQKYFQKYLHKLSSACMQNFILLRVCVHGKQQPKTKRCHFAEHLKIQDSAHECSMLFVAQLFMIFRYQTSIYILLYVRSR